MIRKPLLLAVCAVLVLSLGLWANQAPEVDDQYLGGTMGKEILVILHATDADIDPFDPDAHPLLFELIEGPEHGELVGDLTDVRYGVPHDAAVDLVYVPESGFLGEDMIVYTVTDPMGERPSVPAIVRIVVTQKIYEGSIAGSWITELVIDVENAEISSFGMQISEVYRTGLFSIGGTAEIKLDAGGTAVYDFDTLEFFGDIRMGSWAHDSLVLFDPEAANPADWFDSWRATTALSFGDLMLEHTAFLSGVQSDSYQVFSLSTTVGSVSVSNTLRLEAVPGCGYPFSEDTMRASWRWCDLRLSAEANFTCDEGFEELRLRATGIPVPHLENWLPGMTLDATLIYSLDEEAKVLSTSVKALSDVFDCIEVFVDVDTATVVIGDVSIYGLKIDQTFDNGVRFVSATSLDASRNSQVTGQPDYFELVSLSGPLTLCCNLPGTWRVSTYFQSDEASLFGWGMTSLKVDGRLASRFNLSTELIYRHTTGVFASDPPLEWVIAASVLW